MRPVEFDQLLHQVRRNCDITDARHAGLYSVCGLVMRLRDLYKWEHGLEPWQEGETDSVLQWIGEKENLWESLTEADFDGLSINGQSMDVFDTSTVNQALAATRFYYGAGYAHSLKPTFLLAEVLERQTLNQTPVLILGREYARDLLTLPAFFKDDQVVLRTEAARMFLWDQIAYMGNSGRPALMFALKACGLPNAETETIRKHFDTIWKVQKTLYLHHEVGERHESVFERSIWRNMLADFPHTAVELLARTLKDLLADTGEWGALSHLIEHHDEAALGLYLAFGNGITRQLTKPLIPAFESFTRDPQWDGIARAVRIVHREAADYAHQIMKLYQENRNHKGLPWTRRAIEETMHQCGLL